MKISRDGRMVVSWLQVVLSLLLMACWLEGQSQSRISQPINSSVLMRIPGSTHPLATSRSDRGRVDAGMPMRRMVLVLKPSDQQAAELRKVIDAQKNPDSHSYHQWLTPEQFALKFGPSQGDLDQVTTWLQQQGFSIDSIARGRQWVEFSGTAAQVEQAFHTEMHQYMVDKKMHAANAGDISIPQALSPVLAGVLSLHNFEKHSMRGPAAQVHRDHTTGKLVPDVTVHTSNGDYHYLAPGDYAKIYDTAPLLKSGISGAGIAIAIAGRSDIELSDVQTFRQIFGLPANDPIFIVNGQDPGFGDEVESALDVQWSGAVAPDATIKFVTSASTFTTDGIDLSTSYIVDNVVAPIMSTSYGLCEAFLGNTGNTFYTLLYQQAAAEGITAFVSTGDNGAAGCDPAVSYNAAQNGLAVSGLASTQYNVAVGGTQFSENGNDSAYWGANNNPDFSSALGYIPESVWNESCDPTVDPNFCQGSYLYLLLASSGGASSCSNSVVVNFQINCLGGYSKPSWQAGRGIPKDGVRDVPDLSLAAAGDHDGYLMCVEGSCQTTSVNGHTVLESATVVGGTSAASPSMAGIMALVEQQNGSYVGLANYDFYKLAAKDKLSDCNSSSLTSPTQTNACVFHDVTVGNNSVPGQAGYAAGRGFDVATGLGTVDAANLVQNWKQAKKLGSATSLSSFFTTIQHGQQFPLQVAVSAAAGTGTPSGDFALKTDKYGAVFGGTLNSGTFNRSVTNLPGGEYNLTAHYGGDAMFSGSDSGPLAITVLPEDSTTSLLVYVVNLAGFVVPIYGPLNYGQPTAIQFNVKGLSGVGSPTGTVNIDLDGASMGTFPLDQGGGGWVQVDNLPSTGLLPGHHRFTVTYSGDNSFNPGKPAIFGVGVRRVWPSSFVQTAGSTEVTEGAPVLLLLSVLGEGVESPTGTVQMYDNGHKLGSPITLAPNGPQGKGFAQATAKVSLKAGDHFIRLAYAGDSNYDPVNPNNFNARGAFVSVSPAAGAGDRVQLRQSAATVNLGGSVTYTVTVTGRTGGAAPTGTVYLSSMNGFGIVDPLSLTNGSATFTVQWNQAGAQPVSAVYSGDSNYTPFSSAQLWTRVQPATPTVTLTAAAGTVAAGTQTSLTASVVGQPSNSNLSAPYGQVQFFDSVNGGAMRPMGFAQYLTTGNGGNPIFTLPANLPTGTNVIQVKYLGSQDWSPSKSNTVTVTVQ